MRISRRQMVKALAALPLVGTAVAAASAGERGIVDFPEGTALKFSGYGLGFGILVESMKKHCSTRYRWNLPATLSLTVDPDNAYILHVTVRGDGFCFSEKRGIGLRYAKTSQWIFIGPGVMEPGGVALVEQAREGERWRPVWENQNFSEYVKADAHLQVIRKHSAKALANLQVVELYDRP
jgi:hypothetical protein